MQRLILPLIAVVLLALAIGGVVFGLRTQQNNANTDTQVATLAQSADAPTDTPEPRTTDPDNADFTPDPTSFIRFGIHTPPTKAKNTIRLATYNAENLFDAIDDPTLSGRQEDIDDTKPEPHLQALADTIRALDADILALQEIESEAALTEFRDTYLSDLGYTHLASIDAGDERGIEQAVLSRFPITDIKNWPQRDLGGTHPDKWGNADNWHAGEPMRFHRSPLRVTIEIPARAAGAPDADPYTLTLFVVHAKSGRPGTYWRNAEAIGLREILIQDRAANPTQNTAILGDFNAALTADSLQTLTTAGYSDALADVFTPGDRFHTHESGRRIDFILINPNLAAELVAHSGFVLGTPALPDGLDYRDPYRPEGYASDHYPVAIDITPLETPSSN